jgi:hypothetical protein
MFYISMFYMGLDLNVFELKLLCDNGNPVMCSAVLSSNVFLEKLFLKFGLDV